MVVAMYQRIENQFVDPLGLRVSADPGIEIGGAALNDHHQRIHVRALGAGNQARAQQRQKNF
jgi:uncharacterized circularly permuted ATP-grasp superfamily protein